MPRVEIPGIGIVRFPDNMSREDIMSQATAMQLEASKPLSYDARDLPTSELIKGGFSRGIEGLKGTAFDLLPALGATLIGKDNYAKEQLKEYSERMAAEEAINPTAYKSYKDIGSIGQAFDFAAETIGEVGPDIASFMLGTGIGTIAGKQIAKKSLESTIKKEANEFATKKGFNKEAKEDYAERLVARAKAGAIGAKANEIGANVGLKTGLYGTSLGINVPDIFNSIYQDTGELAPGIALTIGPLVAALDAYLPNKILDQLGLKGKEQLAARMLEKSTVVPITFKRAFAGEILKTGAGEALTEGTQEVLSKFASQLAGDKDPFFSSENVDQIITASLKGLVGGTVYGAPGAAFDARRIKEQSLRQPFTEEPPPITPLGAQQTQPDLFGEQGLATPYSARQDQALTPRQQDIEAMQQAKAMQQPPTAESPRFYQEQQAAQPSPGQQGLDLQGGMTPEQQIVAERDRQNQEMNQLYLEEAQQQVQQARERATIAKEILDEEIALTDERVRLGDIKRTEAERINLLLPIINNLELGTEDSVTLFQQALRSAGYNNLELTEAEQKLLQRADDVKTAIAASLQGELDLQELEFSAANQLTPDVTGIKEKGEKGPAGTPRTEEPGQLKLDLGPLKTPRARPAPTEEAAPEAAPSTVLDANTLDSIGLPKQSGYYRQLVNKDMANPADQEAVRNILATVRQNPNLSPSTKQAIELIAIQAFNALATQQTFLGPRGGILKGADYGRVRSGPTGGVSGAGVPVPSEQAPTEPTKRTRAPKQQRVDSTTEPVDKSGSGEELPSSTLEPKKQITPPTPPAKKVAKEPENIPVNAYTKALRKRIGIVNDKLRTETDPTEKELLRDELEELKLDLSEKTITPDTSANNEVAAELGKLDEAEINALETHYGVARNSEEFLANIKEDVLSYVNKGASAVAKAIRDIIQKIANGLLSVAVVFNASALQPDIFNVPQAFAETRNVSIAAPANVPMSDIAKTTYSLSAPVAIKNKQALFIADKPNGIIHMFDDKGQFIASSNALYGKQAGDILTEESRNKPIEKTTTVDKVTPAGTYELSFSKDLSGDYAGGYTLRFNDKKGDLGGIAVHSVYLGDIKEDRLKKLSSTNLADKKVSFGCVNTSPEFMLDEVLPRAGTIFGSGKKAMAVVIPDQQAMLSSYLTPLTEQIPGQRTTGRAAADLAAKEEQITGTEAESEQRIEGRFRTGAGTGMDKADVQKYIANEIKGWKNAPPVKVIETENQLPKYLQEQIEKENIVNPKGVWDPRTQSVFLISSNLTNNHDATYTVLHEIMGHFGLQKILGSKFDKVMGDIYNSNKAVKDRADNKIANGMDKLVAVEEVLAEMAETATNPSLIQKVVNIIRQALRTLGFDLDTFTNGEILQLLQDSRKFVTGTEGVPIGGTEKVKRGQAMFRESDLYSEIAKFTPKRIDTILRTYAYGTQDNDINKTKAYVGYVSPEDFLKATTTSPEMLKDLETDKRAKPLNVEELAGEIQNILLTLDEDFNLTGHEGRHRMIALRNAGVKQVPVIFMFYRGENRFERQDQRIPPQRFSGDLVVPAVKGQKGFYADLVPVTYVNKDRILKLFGQTEGVPNQARFSTGAGATFRNNPAAPGVNGNDARTIFDSFADRIESAGILNSERADNLHEFIKNGIFGNARKALLYTLPVKPLTEEAKRAGLKMAPQFNTIIDEQSGYVNSLNRRIEPLVQRAEAWAKGAGQKQIDLFNKVVYDSTTLKADPTKPKKADVSQADYDLVKNNYDKLGGAGKSLYVQIRDAYAEMYQEILDSIEDRINTFEIDNDAKTKIKEDILEKLAAKGRIDPYFALTRKGKYWLSYNLETKRADGQVTLEPYIEAYTTERERTKQAVLVEAEGATEVQKFSQISQYKYSRAPSGSFVNNMLNILELNKPKNMSKEESDKYNEAADEVMRLYLSTLPETSFAQSFQKRKGTLGFKRDAIEAMRDRMYSTSQQLGRMRYSAKLSKLLEEMREYSKLTSEGTGEEGEKITPQDNKLMNDYISILEKHAESINNPNVSNISRLINSLGFNYLLGLNISSAVINLGQVPMVVYPYLAGEHGYGEAMSAINRAYKLYLNSGYGKDARTVEVIGTEKRDLAGNITTPAEKVKQRGMPSISNYDPNSAEGKKYGTLIEQAQKQGQINQSQFYDILEVDGRKNFGSTVNAVTGFAFHHGDRINREVSMVAAYDLQLAKLKSQGKTGKEAELEAANYAIYVTEMTNGGVSAASSPLIAKGNIGRVLFMFKRYGVSMYYMLFKITREALKGETPEIRKAAMSQLAGVYGTSALFSGLQGVPMFGIVAMVYNLFADEDEDDMETATRKYVGEFAYKGMLNYVTGAELASRFSLSDLIFRSNPTANSRTFEQGLLENIGGPAYGVMSRIKRGLDFMSEGNMERGVENILPSAISNLFKAYRFGTEGAQSLRGDPIVEDINAFSIAAQAMGFAPAEYVRQLEINSNLKGIEKNILQEKSKLLQKWNVATRMGDIEDANEYKEKLFELNKKHPDLKISEDTFQRSERAFKAATKRTVNGVQFSQKLYDEMMRNAAEYEK